jgi:tetratricopeptide (TPR) repeat protein
MLSNQKNEIKSFEKFFSRKKNSLVKKNDLFNLQVNLSKYRIIIATIFLSSSFFIFNSIIAEAQLNSPSMINSTQLETLYNTANNFYDNQKYDEAIQYYDKVLAINPSAVGALNSKGLALDHLQRYDEALQSFDKALEIDPSSVNALNNKGLALDHLQRYDEALSYFDKALSINPSSVNALTNKGLALDHLQRYDEALQSFDKALEIDPSNPKALDGKASILSKVKQEG